MLPEEIIVRPIVTEKSSGSIAEGKYTFEVAKKATKVQIAKAVESLFNVKVLNVNTMTVKGKEKRVLYLQKNVKSLELKEYEIFIINQIFKTNEKIIFDDYIKSSKFKQDFKVFDNMMDRRSEIRSTYKSSVLNRIFAPINDFINILLALSPNSKIHINFLQLCFSKEGIKYFFKTLIPFNI